MKCKAIFCIILALSLFCIPALADDIYTLLPSSHESSAIVPVVSNGENNYGYLQVQSVQFTIKNKDADVIVTYDIEPWMAFLVYLFGEADLEKRVLGVLQYPESGYNQEITFKHLDTSRAILHITNVGLENQGDNYWYRAHTFGCTIPHLSFILSANDVKEYVNVMEMPKGFGYFKS